MASSEVGCDVVVLGAGSAGIAAARYLSSEFHLSVIVVEARNRTGGRAHTSDVLGTGLPLDHGGKWIHGSCSENRMIQLYEKANCSEFDSRWSPSRAKGNEIRMILPNRRDSSSLIRTKEPSPLAKRTSGKAFGELIMSTMDDPIPHFEPDDAKRVDEKIIRPDLTLEELVMKSFGEKLTIDPETTNGEKSRLHIYREIVRQTDAFTEALAAALLQDDVFDEDEFLDEVMSLFNLETYRRLESWEGAPLNRISALYGYDGSILPGGNTSVPCGYGEYVRRLAQPLLDQQCILLGHKVVSVTTENSEFSGHATKSDVIVGCELEDGSNKTISANACIIALPIGVLRHGLQAQEKSDTSFQLRFDPTLPPSIIKAIDILGIAVMNKVELSFPKRWWPQNAGRLHVTSPLQSPTYHPWPDFVVESSSTENNPERPNVLVGYLGGAFAKEIENKSNEEIQTECMKTLRMAGFVLNPEEIPDPTNINVTRWHRDPFSRGTWTFFAKNSNNDNAQEFRLNSECQRRGLFFAGEHTCDGHVPGLDMGTIHGAWLSGELAAKRAMEFLNAHKKSSPMVSDKTKDKS